MKTSRKIWLLVILVVALTLVFVACADKPDPIVIVNNTTQDLTIFINDKNIGNVEPGHQLKNTVIWGYSKYNVQAKNNSGEVIYQNDYTYEEMKKIKWEITIPSS